MRKRRLVLSGVILAGVLGLPWPFAAWMRERSRRAEAVRIAERVYFQEFGQPAPTTLLPSADFARSADVQWVPARQAYVVKFSSQFLSDSTSWTVFGRPVPLTSLTTVTGFEVTPGGRCTYIGLVTGGSY